MSTVYVVVGSTGEYSDRTEWPVAAYAEEDVAKTHVQLATAAAKELEGRKASRYDDPPGPNPYDADMKMDYTGTSYYLIAVPLLTAVPNVTVSA